MTMGMRMGWTTGRLLVALACLGLGGCTTTSLTGPASTRPATADSIIAAMKGGLIGGDLGSNLASRDRRKALEAEYRALEYSEPGKPVTWRSEDGRVTGRVVAAQPYRVGSQDCRQYSHSVGNGVEEADARGTACRSPNGSWTPLT
jgi:surface antigen